MKKTTRTGHHQHQGGGSVTTYDLTVTRAGAGASSLQVVDDFGQINAIASDFVGTYAAGTTVVLTGTPTPTWSGDGTGTTTRTVVMTGNKAVTATYAGATVGGIISGTGSRLYVDDCSVASVTAAGWDNIDDCFTTQGAWTVGDGQITQQTSGADTHQMTTGATTPYYRRYKTSDVIIDGAQALDASLTIESIAGRDDVPSVGYGRINGKGFHYTSKTNTSLDGITNTDGYTGTAADGDRVSLQSLYDAPRNTRTRTQSFVPGQRHELRGTERIYRIPIRCYGDTMGLTDLQSGNCQMLQWKQFPNSDLIWAINEMKTKWQVRLQQAAGGAGAALTLFEFAKPAGREQAWILWQIAQKFDTQANGGYLQIWADLNVAGQMIDLTGQTSVTTMFAGYTDNRYSHGEYQPTTSPGIQRDYGFLEVCNFIHP